MPTIHEDDMIGANQPIRRLHEALTAHIAAETVFSLLQQQMADEEEAQHQRELASLERRQSRNRPRDPGS